MEETKPETVQVEFEFTGSDAFRAALWVFFRPASMRFIFAAFAFSLVYGALTISRGDRSGITKFLVLTVFYVALPILVGASGLIAQRRLPLARRQQRYELSDAGIAIVSAVGQSTTSWEAYQRVEESGRAFYLSPQNRIWHFLPKRALKGQGDLERLRSLFVKHLGKRARVSASKSLPGGRGA
jgi:hypothetical protein